MEKDRPPTRISKVKGNLEGMLIFRQGFNGMLVTETMLVKGLNDTADSAKALGEFLSQLNPNCAYLLIPTRPPAEEWVQPPDEEAVLSFYNTLLPRVQKVEYLIGYEGSSFSFSGDVEKEILSITAVHPMREDAVREMIQRAGVPWSLIDQLVVSDRLRKVQYQGETFYLRSFNRHAGKT